MTINIKLERNDPTYSFNSFESSINNVIDKYIPLKKLIKEDLKMRIKPWITNDICNSIKRREKLYKKL